MPFPALAAAAIPFGEVAGMSLLGGGAAAGGAAAGGLGATLGGAGMLASGLGSAFSGLFGGGGEALGNQLAGEFTRLAPINTRLTYAGQELMANIAPYLGAQAAQTNLLGQSMYDIFSGAKSKESLLQGVQTAAGLGFLGEAIKAQGLAGSAKPAIELKAAETQAKLGEKGADVLGLQYSNLAKGLTDVGVGAGNIRNQQVMAQTQANLDIGKRLSEIQGQTIAQGKLRSQAAGMALSPRFA